MVQYGNVNKVMDVKKFNQRNSIMVSTDKFKIENKGGYWHVLRLYTIGWGFFKSNFCKTESFHWYKEKAECELKTILKRTKTRVR